MYPRFAGRLAKVFCLVLFAGILVTAHEAMGQTNPRIVREVRHELVTLPYYGVFDWLEYEVQNDGTVILRGQVVRPTTKSDAEGRVKNIDGVRGVVNQIGPSWKLSAFSARPRNASRVDVAVAVITTVAVRPRRSARS